MTLRSSDLQSDSDLDSIRNSCDVYCAGEGVTENEDFVSFVLCIARVDICWDCRDRGVICVFLCFYALLL